MPALVNSRLGSLRGTSGEDGTTACCRSRKKSRKLARTSVRLCMRTYVTATSTDVIPEGGLARRIGYLLVPGCSIRFPDLPYPPSPRFESRRGGLLRDRPFRSRSPCQQGTGKLLNPGLFLRVGRGLTVAMGEDLAEQPGILADRGLDLGGDVGVLGEEILGGLAPLADALAAIRHPGAGLLHDPGLDTEVEQFARLGDADAIHDVELELLEGGRDLVLDHLHPGLVADHVVAVLDRADAADIEPHRGIELQRVAARRRLRIAEHDADLHADLVDEDDDGVGLGDRAGELAQRLAHQPRLLPRQLVAHLPFAL